MGKAKDSVSEVKTKTGVATSIGKGRFGELICGGLDPVTGRNPLAGHGFGQLRWLLYRE